MPPVPAGSQGRLHTVQGPAGWEKYYYDGYGRPSRVVTQVGDNAMPSDVNTAGEDENRVRTVSYLRVDGWPLEETMVKVNSVEVSHAYRRFQTETINGTAFEVEELIECQNRDVLSPDAAGNLHTKTYVYPATHTSFAFRPHKIIKSDGTMVKYDYLENLVAKTMKTTTWEGQPNAGFSDVVDGTKTERTVDRAGNLQLEQVFHVVAGVAGSTVVAQTQATIFDSSGSGRPTRLVYEDGSFSQMEYACCGLQSSTDRAGVTTTYQYDRGKRLEYEFVPGYQVGTFLVLHHVYDAAGRLDYEERYNTANAGDLIRLKDYTYDDASRVINVTEPMRNPGETAGTTLYTLSVSTDGLGHRVLTTRYPNLSTRREVFAKDGKLIRVDGTAAHPVEYEHGVDTDGEYTKEIRIRVSGGSEVKSEWVKTYTDLLGRPWKTAYPAFGGGSPSASFRTYSPSTGQLVSSTDPDGVVQLVEYDGKGRPVRQAVDVNRNGVIEEGIDQVTQTANTWVSTTPPGGGTIMVNQTVSAEWKDAAVVPIVNPSFETVTLSDGQTTPIVSGWAKSGSAGVINPPASYYSQAVPAGNNVAYLGPSTGSISQGNLGAIVANRQYRLKLKLGRRLTGSIPSAATVKLKQGSTVLLSQTAPSITAGTFATMELVYFATAASANQLGIEISSGGNGFVDVDQVELQTSDRVVAATAVASASGHYSAQTAFGLTTTRQIAYSPASFKITETVTHPDNSRVTSESINGRLCFVTVEANASGTPTQLARTEFQYDNHGRVQYVLETRGAAVGTTTYAYYKDGRIASETSPVPEPGAARLTTSYTYNDFVTDGRTLTVMLPDNSLVNYKFRLTDQLRSLSGSQKTPAEYDYDEQGRLKTITTWRDLSTPATKAATTETTTFAYDVNRGFMTTKIINGVVGPTYDFHDSGRLRKRTWNRTVTGLPLYTAYSYNFAGALQTVDYSDVAGTEVTYTYDSRGRVKTVADPSGMHTYTYRDDGQLLQEAHSGSGSVLNGLSMNWIYDGLNRLQTITARSGGGSTTLFSQGLGYKPNCSMLNYVSCNGSYVTYDYLSGTALPQTVSHRQGSATTTPLFSTALGHDALNRLRSLTHSAAPNPGYPDVGYDSLSRKRSVILTEASRWDYGYDASGQLRTADRAWSDNVPVAGQQFEYYYDQAGNRTRTLRDGQGATSRTANYTADNANRYNSRNVLGFVNIIGTADAGATVSATVGANSYRAEQHGTYFRCEVPVPTGADPVITIQGVKPVAGQDNLTTTTATVNVPPALQSFTYDGDGNLKTDGVWTYTWDGENRLTEMERASNIRLKFTYDYAGRRVKKSVEQWVSVNGAYGTPQITRFLYDGWHLVAELAATDLLTRGYVWGLTIGGSLSPADGIGSLAMFWNKAASTLHYVTQDPFGNVAGLVNASSGALEGRFEYSPFGELIHASGTAAGCPIRFSNRYWDSETALVYYGYRYYSPSMGRWINRDPVAEDGGANVYSFVFNSPLVWFDNDGLEPHKWTEEDYIKQARPDPANPLRWRGADGRYMEVPQSPGSIEQTPRPAPPRGIGVPSNRSVGSKKGDTLGGAAAGGVGIAADLLNSFANYVTKGELVQKGVAECLTQAKKGSCGGCCVIHLYTLKEITTSKTRYAYNPARFIANKPCSVARIENEEAYYSSEPAYRVDHRRQEATKWLYRFLYDLGKRKDAPAAPLTHDLDVQYYTPEYREILSLQLK